MAGEDVTLTVALANRPGEYRTTGRETLIGRETYILEWRPTPGGPIIDRFWVDSSTGIILRWENYRKPDGAAITVEAYITKILVNVELPINAFDSESLSCSATAITLIV